ncbi:phosphotransferase [Actinoplanes sp. NPDC048796]|uniref:phosphotransferase n=1 Tax=Actinoplanes sp. NPDC048796 TaxID=3155640 RepID=UPI0033CC7708
MDLAEADPLQHSVHAVIRFPRARVVIRLSPDSLSDSHLVRVAAALTEAGAPTVRLWTPEPARAEGWSATAWHLLPPPPPERFPAAALAEPLRRLHRCRLPIELPPWDLPGTIHAAVNRPLPPDWAPAALGLTTEDLRGRLAAICREIADELAAGPTFGELGVGTVHGDAHTGNLLRDPGRGAVLCDLDTVAWGPPEVDLVPAAHGVERFRRDPGDYGRLVEVYGFDVRDSPAWPALRRLRDLQLAVYPLARPPAGDELARRVRTVLDDDHDAVWARFGGYA